jgi:Fungal protein kinase
MPTCVYGISRVRMSWLQNLSISLQCVIPFTFHRRKRLLTVILEKDFENLIHIFTSLAYATQLELGFDPTIVRVMHDDKVQYRIEVDGKSFVTTDTLSDYRADAICGRATRVFKAFEVDRPDVTVALKDVYVDATYKTEGDLLHEVFQRMREKKMIVGDGVDEFADDDPRQYFLTVRAHGYVKTNGIEFDNTLTVMMRNHSLPSDCPHYCPRPSNQSQSSPRVTHSDRVVSVGHTPCLEYSGIGLPIVKRFSPRMHYRIVFNEVGRTIHDLELLSDIFQSLHGATQGKSI